MKLHSHTTPYPPNPKRLLHISGYPMHQVCERLFLLPLQNSSAPLTHINWTHSPSRRRQFYIWNVKVKNKIISIGKKKKALGIAQRSLIKSIQYARGCCLKEPIPHSIIVVGVVLHFQQGHSSSGGRVNYSFEHNTHHTSNGASSENFHVTELLTSLNFPGPANAL